MAVSLARGSGKAGPAGLLNTNILMLIFMELNDNLYPPRPFSGFQNSFISYNSGPVIKYWGDWEQDTPFKNIGKTKQIKQIYQSYKLNTTK